jgi:hypothetical protein
METVAIMEEVGMDTQLASLYAEKELLERELGISDASDLVLMVRNMEAQLGALYEEREAK